MSKSKNFITTSAVILSMATPVVGTVSNLGTVFAEDNSTSNISSESVDAKLQRATDVRDVAHKEFVDATVEYTLANRVKTASDVDKKTAEDNLAKAEKVTKDAQKALTDANKVISDNTTIVNTEAKNITVAENRIENLKNVRELAENKLKDATDTKKTIDAKVVETKKVIEDQKKIVSTEEAKIPVAEQAKVEPTADIKHFEKLLKAAKADLAEAKSGTDAYSQAQGNVKTFETAIKQAQDKITEALNTIKSANEAIKNAKAEIAKQEKTLASQEKEAKAAADAVSLQEKAIKDNNDLIAEQEGKISESNKKTSESNKLIDSSRAVKATSEKTISDNASVIKSAKDVLTEVTKVAKTNSDKFESAKTRLDKAEKDLQVKQATVDALRAESVKEKANVTPSTTPESKTDTKESEKPKSDTVTVKVKNVDTDGKVLSETESKAKMNDNVTISKVDGYDVVGAAFATAKSATDVDVAKGFVASEDGTLTVVHRKQSTVVKPAETKTEDKTSENKSDKPVENKVDDKTTNNKADKLAENKVEDKTTDNNANKASDNKTEDKTSDNKSDKSADNKVDDKTTDNNANKSTDNKSEDKTDNNKSSDNKTEDTSAKTTVDGVITQMKFDKITENEVHFSGMIDKSKLAEGQKLEGDHAKVVVTSGDGTELGSFNVRDDYKFDGILKSTPKDGETLIVKYGGKNYELPYGLTKADNNQQAQTDNSTIGQKATDGATKEKRDVKASLLPSTGQQSPIGIAIAGITMVVLGAVALFMKFRSKKSEE